METKIRIAWLDSFKAISMYFVVLGHSLLKFKGGKIFRFIYSFHMPLFFMLSGFVFRPDKYISLKECIKDKAVKLLYPYVLLNIIALPLWYYNVQTKMIPGDSIGRVLFGIVYSNSAVSRGPSNATWFLPTLFLTEVIYYGIHHYMKDNKSVFLLSCIIAILGVISPLGSEFYDAPWHLDVALVAQFFYGCGYILRKNFDEFIQYFQKYTWLKVLFLIFITYFFSRINKQVDLSNELYRNIVYTLISSFSMSFALFIIFSKIKIHSQLLSYIGQNTIIVLAFHILVLRILQAFIPEFMSNQYYAICASVIVYVCMIPFIWIINTFIPFATKMPKKLRIFIQNL